MKIGPSHSVMGTSMKTIDLQKKVSEAIANSMNAISKFKTVKTSQISG